MAREQGRGGGGRSGGGGIPFGAPDCIERMEEPAFRKAPSVKKAFASDILTHNISRKGQLSASLGEPKSKIFAQNGPDEVG